MEKTYEIAIIGPKETILGFKALGLVPIPATTVQEAVAKLYELTKDKIKEPDGEERSRFAIIFVIEDLAREIPIQDYKKLSGFVLPSIIPISGPKGSSGFSSIRIARMVEQAVGSDIFGDK